MVERDALIDMVCAVQRGEDGAATRLYNTFYYDLYCCIMDKVDDPELAADLTQNAFMEIFTTIGKLEEPAAFVTWSRRIAGHCCTSYFRKRHELLADELEDHSAFDTIEELREEFIPGEALDKEDLRKTICAMIDELPEEQRSAILMRYFEEIPVKEIARRQGVTEGTVKSRLNYGRQAIKQAVEKFEKKHNIKLHCTGTIPLLLWMFREYRVVNGISLTAEVTATAFSSGAAEQTAAAAATVLTATASVGAANAAAGAATGTAAGVAAGAGAGAALTTKVIAGITAVAITVGGVTAAVVTGAEKTDRYTSPEATVASQAAELSFVLSSDGSHYEVRGMGTLTASEIIIPAEYNGLPVTAIGPYAFMDCVGLLSVSIPDSVATIGEQAFSGCTGLTDVNVPNGVTTIAAGTFIGCANLTGVFLPESLTAIGDAAFWGCGSLSKIKIPDSVTTIGPGAFCDCCSLTGLTLSGNISEIGEHAFAGCTGLEYIAVAQENSVYHSAGNCLIQTAEKTLILGCKNSAIPTDGTVTAIGPSAFDECDALTRIAVPASVTLIQSTAFYGCENLTDINYGGTMSQWDAVAHSLNSDGIGDYTVHCTDGIVYRDVHQAVVPESQRGLAFTLSSDGTFYRVTPEIATITEATIPATYNGLPVRQINFFSCESLTRVTIPTSVTALETEAFAFCSDLTDVTLPDTMTSIGAYAFSGCVGLRNITIPAGVTELGKHAFDSCTALTDIYFGGTKEQWNDVQKGSDWDYRMGLYVIHCSDGDISKEVSQTAPAEGSVGLNYTLNTDGISYAVSGIGDCTDADVVIPSKYNGLSVTAVDEEAFYGNAQITGITIPASVTAIGDHFIGENAALEKLVVESGNPVYHSDGNCIIETGTKTLIAGCKASVIPADGSVTGIGDYGFFGAGLTAISVPDAVTTVGYMAFSQNFDLTEITLPATLTEISGSLFNFCSSLTRINYRGTMAQWSALEKGPYWDYETGAYTIHCADGDLPKE